MKFKIRESRTEDMESVLSLLHALAVFEKEPDAVELTVEDLVSDGFGTESVFIVLSRAFLWLKDERFR